MMKTDRPPHRVWSAALAHTMTKPVIAVVMGVCGSGKTTVAVLLAAALGCQFQEGDDLHPAANVEKMHGGTPLTDADRWPWLQKIAEEIDGWRAREESGVMTCSAEAFLPGHHCRTSAGCDVSPKPELRASGCCERSLAVLTT